jgi:hypothetical protein
VTALHEQADGGTDEGDDGADQNGAVQAVVMDLGSARDGRWLRVYTAAVLDAIREP